MLAPFEDEPIEITAARLSAAVKLCEGEIREEAFEKGLRRGASVGMSIGGTVGVVLGLAFAWLWG